MTMIQLWIVAVSPVGLLRRSKGLREKRLDSVQKVPSPSQIFTLFRPKM